MREIIENAFQVRLANLVQRRITQLVCNQRNCPRSSLSYKQFEAAKGELQMLYAELYKAELVPEDRKHLELYRLR
jgi:hypothetical protein